MNFTAAFPGKYIQGENATGEMLRFARQLGEKLLIIASPTAIGKILPHYGIIAVEGHIILEEFNGECCEKELDRLSGIAEVHQVEVILGMGGGKVIDTAKIVADRASLPVVIVPTIASTDAPCSGCAVIYTEEGVFESVYYQKMNPQVVLVDSAVIAQAPMRFLVAGMGDALSTWFEARSCVDSKSPNVCGGLSTMTALNLARLCYDTLLKYGTAAKQACEEHVVNPALEYIIEANTLLSGIGFESSGLATAHAVHNGLSVLPETHAFYHGEKVAIGVLTGLFLNGATPDETETVYAFCEEVGLPTTFGEIGIIDPTDEKLMAVARKTCAAGESIHHETMAATPELVMLAMRAADQMGMARKRMVARSQH